MTLAAIPKITTVYVQKVRERPERVPFGMDLLGSFRSPDILAPLNDTVSKDHQRRVTGGSIRKNSTCCRE